nr:hypothetical protein [Stenotrophomonas rhizophila]
MLAACSPRVADHSADEARATPPGAVVAAAHASTEPATSTPPEAAPQASHSAGMPGLNELQRAHADAGCEVSNAIGDLDDIGIYCQMPADVRAFLERENLCQHFAGEEPYDAARKRDLEAAWAEFCDGRERRFEALYEHHFDDCAIRHALIGVGKRYDLFTDTAPDYCRPQDMR